MLASAYTQGSKWYQMVGGLAGVLQGALYNREGICYEASSSVEEVP